VVSVSERVSPLLSTLRLELMQPGNMRLTLPHSSGNDPLIIWRYLVWWRWSCGGFDWFWL